MTTPTWYITGMFSKLWTLETHPLVRSGKQCDRVGLCNEYPATVTLPPQQPFSQLDKDQQSIRVMPWLKGASVFKTATSRGLPAWHKNTTLAPTLQPSCVNTSTLLPPACGKWAHVTHRTITWQSHDMRHCLPFTTCAQVSTWHWSRTIPVPHEEEEDRTPHTYRMTLQSCTRWLTPPSGTPMLATPAGEYNVSVIRVWVHPVSCYCSRFQWHPHMKRHGTPTGNMHLMNLPHRM